MNAVPHFHYSSRAAGQTTTLGDVELAIQVSTGRTKLRLKSVSYLRKTGANAGTNQPRVYDTAGAAASLISQAWRAAAASAAGDLVRATNIDVDMLTDANGRIYTIVDGNHANAFDIEVWAEVLA